jgi:hypothetical protein
MLIDKINECERALRMTGKMTKQKRKKFDANEVIIEASRSVFLNLKEDYLSSLLHDSQNTNTIGKATNNSDYLCYFTMYFLK